MVKIRMPHLLFIITDNISNFNNRIKLDDAFLQLPDTFTHTKQRLSTTPCHINQHLYTLYMFIFQYKCMYIYTKQISPPLSFASFKFLYASMHSDVSQFCTNTTFIIVNCIPPFFIFLYNYVCICALNAFNIC